VSGPAHANTTTNIIWFNQIMIRNNEGMEQRRVMMEPISVIMVKNKLLEESVWGMKWKIWLCKD
jgi:hypothetical protein